MSNSTGEVGFGVTLGLIAVASVVVGTLLYRGTELPAMRALAIAEETGSPTQQGSASTAGPDTTTSTTADTSPPTTLTPEQVELAEAGEAIPDVVLDTLGGRNAVQVVAHDTLDDAAEGWTGANILIDGGRAVVGEGLYLLGDQLETPIAIVGRVAYTPGAWFEIGLESGEWNTPGFRRWGIYGGDDDQFSSNVWEGQLQADLGFDPLSSAPGQDYWIVLAVNADSAMFGIWPEGSNDGPQGATMDIDWVVPQWTLAIQIFGQGGLLNVDEYYALSP